MSNGTEFKIYKRRDDLTGKMYDQINCIGNRQLVFDRVIKIKFYFSNGENYSIDQVSSFEFDLNKEVNITNVLFVPSIYNMQFEPCYINKIVVDGLFVDIYNPEELLYGTTEFINLNIYNINSGFNTDSTMRIILRYNSWESL